MLAPSEWCWLMAAAGWARTVIWMSRKGIEVACCFVQGSDVGGGVQGVAGGVELGSERYARLVSANVGVGLGALVEVFGLGDGVGELRLGIGESTFLLRLFDGGGRLREFVEGCLRLLVARVRSVGALFEMYRGEVRCAVRNFVRHVMFGHLA